jgi:hypothetical protein
MSAVWRWRTSGLPTWGGRPETAFMPLVTKTAETWQSFKEWLTGQPGTQPIPAPCNDIPRDRLAVGDGQAYARDFGGYWFPQLWFQESAGPGVKSGQYPAGGNDTGVCIFSDNQLPVPAIEPQRGTRRLGGGTVTPVYQQPRQPVRPVRKVSSRHA